MGVDFGLPHTDSRRPLNWFVPQGTSWEGKHDHANNLSELNLYLYVSPSKGDQWHQQGKILDHVDRKTNTCIETVLRNLVTRQRQFADNRLVAFPRFLD